MTDENATTKTQDQESVEATTAETSSAESAATAQADSDVASAEKKDSPSGEQPEQTSDTKEQSETSEEASSSAEGSVETAKEEDVVEFGRPAGPQIETIMTKKVITISPSTTIGEAVSIIEKHKLGQLPVVDDGRYVGMINKADLFHVKSVFAGTPSETPRDAALSQLSVSTVLRTNNLPTITPDRTLGEVVGLMKNKNLRSVAITDPNKHLLGIVAHYDILDYFDKKGIFE